MTDQVQIEIFDLKLEKNPILPENYIKNTGQSDQTQILPDHVIGPCHGSDVDQHFLTRNSK